jgi:hypothetical protein
VLNFAIYASPMMAVMRPPVPFPGQDVSEARHALPASTISFPIVAV